MNADKRLRVLYVSHGQQQCGVFQFGNRIAKALQASQTFNFVYVKCECEHDLRLAVRDNSPSVVIYNYNPLTMGWLTSAITRTLNVLQVGTIHEVTQSIADSLDCSLFHYHIAPDPTLLLKNPNVFKTGRLLPKFMSQDHSIPERLTIGSFGFGTNGKGIESLVATVQESFDDVVVRLHLPSAKFGDPNGSKAQLIGEQCRKLLYKPNVELQVTHDFMDDVALLSFLASNSLNAFFYNEMQGRGISSVIDYALAVGRPIAVRRTSMFRHLWHVNPSICVEDRTLPDILSSGSGPLDRFRNEWCEENLVWEYERIVQSVLDREPPKLLSAPTLSRRVYRKVKRTVFGDPVSNVSHGSWISDTHHQADNWSGQAKDSYVPVEIKGQKLNRILDDNARRLYAPAISKMFKLLPDLMSRKLFKANVQQAFAFDTVMRFASHFANNPRVLCVGSFEDSSAWALRRLGIVIEEVDPMINFDLSAFVDRPSNRDRKFDIIFSVSVIEHVKDDERFVREIATLLSPGGIAILTCDFNNDYAAGTPKPSVDERLYTEEDLNTRLLTNLTGCELIDSPDWECKEPDFYWEGCRYAFASLVVRKN